MPGPKKRLTIWARFGKSLLWATPGQLDAGLASLATFIAGLSALRNLGSEALGAYSLLFAAFLVASQLPAEAIFGPSQVLAVDLDRSRRLGMLRHSWSRGVAFGAIGALLVPAGIIPILGVVDLKELVPLLATVVPLALVSPLQDHVRSMFHIAGLSWLATTTSAIHFAATGAGLVVLTRTGPATAPFGALVIGNSVSLGMALIWIKYRKAPHVPRPGLRELISLGGWLVGIGLSRTVLGYAARTLLNAVVGITSLGYVEGARIVSQPIYVLASGLSAQVGPQATEAASKGDLSQARKWRRRFALLLSLGAVPYALLTAFPSPLNLFEELAPRAYVIPGLTGAMLFAVWMNSLLRPIKAEFLGARKQRYLAYVMIAAGAIELVIIGIASGLGTFSAPLALAVATSATWLGADRLMNHFYRSHSVIRDGIRRATSDDQQVRSGNDLETAQTEPNGELDLSD